MRGLTTTEVSVLEDAADPPFSAEEWAFMDACPSDEDTMSPAEVAAAEGLMRRGCVVPDTHGEIRLWNITARGRIALSLARSLPNGGDGAER